MCDIINVLKLFPTEYPIRYRVTKSIALELQFCAQFFADLDI